ncbi:hypothetical protein CC78DRAFT_469656 [Lojkania enalia]|uniref:Zn(2)-C6 fungal-type domain-containing protein n=1 Tax=Lojkania enalia TaxID=147567 RepID=A0A9P4K909_9PLEO|nr:hypothetical protein CC78DRAFT_469656 [Didymosphaeria enalia]
MKKADHNCWTCKERKVGCDRTLPECANCKRANRHCQGYALKLAWPDKIDGRRKQKKYQADPGRSTKDYVTQDGKLVFLNTTLDDLSGRKIDVQDFTKLEKVFSSLVISPAISAMTGVTDNDGLLLSYYDNVLARMITTIDDDTNGFRRSLIPMALSSSDPASRSLLQATLALSSFHLGRNEDALRHKVKALKSLSSSFQNGNSSKLSQFAACMMLCVYSVFDASDTTWYLHLQGAKTITAELSNELANPSFDFFSNWFAYHDTFSNYSHSENPLGGKLNITLPENNLKTRKVCQIIVGSLGCSPELLGFISAINQLRTFSPENPYTLSQPPPQIATLTTTIRDRLINLSQEIHVSVGETVGTIDHSRITLTAEFYRIAALLYLYQTYPPLAIPSPSLIQDLVNAGFAIVDQMQVCTSPWPLFIVACSVTTDVDRVRVLGILDKMSEMRRIGNYEIIKGLIVAVWKQQDLGADEKNPGTVDWRGLMDPGSSVPSFI